VQHDGNYWLVGAYWDDRDPSDQTSRFIREGIWENGYEDKLLEKVNSVQAGDKIAIKAVQTRKADLPFDAKGKSVSCLIIKAIGTVTENVGDGHRLIVSWDIQNSEPRRWYFYTYRGTIWKLKKGDPSADRLINFAFGGAAQDYAWFLNQSVSDLTQSNRSKDSPSLPNIQDVDESDAVIDTLPAYGIDDLVEEGAFISARELELILARWRSKKNIVLQGAPGVGKTFLARRLAYALMEEQNDKRIGAVQFHQSYAYDDFVRGYRPATGGGFALQDGVFKTFCSDASADPDPTRPWIFIIDEINRGNLSQIFGELLMLIEADKRSRKYAVPLVYKRSEGERFFVPPNVHVIGLMNVADRSLALVDYALRRRFAFIELAPQYDSPRFREWLLSRHMDEGLTSMIIQRMISLNDIIEADPLLGRPYRVGHSFFCPRGDDFTELSRSWFDAIVETEIVPLLAEYWFDDPSKVEQARQALIAP
jgi:5-methylcytosine-specific restriction protein B